MKFKDLSVGDVFVFASEENPDPILRFSGMAKGPWVKQSARKYYRQGQGEFVCRVGSINAEVIKK